MQCKKYHRGRTTLSRCAVGICPQTPTNGARARALSLSGACVCVCVCACVPYANAKSSKRTDLIVSDEVANRVELRTKFTKDVLVVYPTNQQVHHPSVTLCGKCETAWVAFGWPHQKRSDSTSATNSTHAHANANRKRGQVSDRSKIRQHQHTSTQ